MASDSEAESDTEGQKGKWGGDFWGFGSFNPPPEHAIHQPQGLIELCLLYGSMEITKQTSGILCGRHMPILSS